MRRSLGDRTTAPPSERDVWACRLCAGLPEYAGPSAFRRHCRQAHPDLEDAAGRIPLTRFRTGTVVVHRWRYTTYLYTLPDGRPLAEEHVQMRTSHA